MKTNLEMAKAELEEIKAAILILRTQLRQCEEAIVNLKEVLGLDEVG